MFASLNFYVILSCVYLESLSGEVARGTVNANIKVNKCCEVNEIYQGSYCRVVNKTSEEWRPIFTSENGKTNLQIDYTLVTGLPDCGHTQLWAIYQTQNSTDRLHLLPNGVLRHFYEHFEIPEEKYNITGSSDEKQMLYYDYEPGKYCLDKKEYGFKSEFAWVCFQQLNKKKSKKIVQCMIPMLQQT